MQGAGRQSGFRALLLLWVLLPAIGLAQTNVGRIGYIDLKRLLDNAPQMLDSRDRIAHEFAPRDALIKAAETKLTSLKQRYERDSALMGKDAADALKREIEATERANKRTTEESRNELNSRLAAERDRNWQEIQNTLIEYARAENYDLIVPSPVVYFNPHIDITDAILDRLKRAAQRDKSKP